MGACVTVGVVHILFTHASLEAIDYLFYEVFSLLTLPLLHSFMSLLQSFKSYHPPHFMVQVQ